jgi:hypothetical protein
MKACQGCGRDFLPKPPRGRPQLYCSINCGRAYQKRRREAHMPVTAMNTPQYAITAVRKLRLEIAGLRAQIEAMREDIHALAVRTWRPDHRRIADGGQPVSLQRRAAGLPRKPRRAA